MCKNGTFCIFYPKLYILLSMGSSTNRRNEIIFWRGIISTKYGIPKPIATRTCAICPINCGAFKSPSLRFEGIESWLGIFYKNKSILIDSPA